MERLNRFFILLCLCFCASVANAQVGEHRNDFSIGFTGGCTMNKMDFNPRIKQKYKFDPMVGFAARYVSEKYFTAICGVMMEVDYCNLGWEEFVEDKSFSYVRDLHYVEVPLLMQMGWGRERRGFKFFIEAGPQLGYYLSGNKEMRGELPENMSETNREFADYRHYEEPYNRFDYGIAGGAGLELSTPVGHFLLQGRYYFGLGDVFDNSKRGKYGRSAHQTISAKVTYLFDISRTKGNIK